MANTATLLLLSGLITSAPVSGGVVFHQDFNDINAGTVLLNSQIKDAFAPVTSGIRNEASPGATVVADPANSGRGNVFRMFFPKGGVGNTNAGGSWQTRIPASDEYYFAYDIYLPVGFNFPLSSKLPGLFGGNMGKASGNKAKMNGVDGFSVFQGFTSEKKAGDRTGWSNIGDGNFGASTFTYAKPQEKRRYNPNLNDDWDGDQARLIPGRWMRLEQHVKLNDATSTVGVGVKANGIYEAWLDGVKVFYADDWIYRQTTSLQIDGIFFVWWYGGSGPNFASREDQHIYTDNFVVSRQPISHVDPEP